MDKASRKIVILGGGAGGLELAAMLARERDLAVTLVDKEGSHLWKPRLHEFAAGTADSMLTEMSFYALSQSLGFHFEHGTVDSIDRGGKLVRLAARTVPGQGIEAPPRSVPYERLVIALGGVTPDFGTKGVPEYAIRLDDPADAYRFREMFITLLLRARATGQPAKIAIVGSGATGTELAAHLRAAEKAFRNVGESPENWPHLEIQILEAASELMGGANDRLRHGLKDRLDRLDIKTRTSAEISEVTSSQVRSGDGGAWDADLTVWAAGLVGHPCLARLSDFETDRKGRIVVDEYLRSTIDDGIHVIGDAASFVPPGDERPLPPTAQCASQQAHWLAEAMPRLIQHRAVKPFRFQDHGRLLSIGPAGSIGSIDLFGRKKDLLIEGRFAMAAYKSLQRRHQLTVLGRIRGSVAILADMISPAGGPPLKLHS